MIAILTFLSVASARFTLCREFGTERCSELFVLGCWGQGIRVSSSIQTLNPKPYKPYKPYKPKPINPINPTNPKPFRLEKFVPYLKDPGLVQPNMVWFILLVSP